MTGKQTHYDGGCLCGAVRYRISGLPDWAAHCHCRSCQKAIGAAFATWCAADADAFEVTAGSITIYQSSPGVERGFCAACGTSLTYVAKGTWSGQDWTGQVWFVGPTLDDPSIIEPKSHVYVSHRQPWVQLDDGLPLHEEF